MREEKYDISGMHCAACSASVERVTRKLPGVARSEVNLTTGIMTIAYDESQCTQEQIVAKVEKAGFGAALHLEHPAPATVQNAEDAETAALKRRKIELIAAAVFSAVLLYVSMGQMLPFGLPALPLPDLFSMHTHPMNFAVLQLILAVPVLYCGRNFFQGGFKSLFHGNPNMDSLVAIGSGCSFAYSLVMTFLISDDPSYVHNLYYESAAVVLTLVSLGKFLESRNMQKTKGAITALMQLSPDTAILADTGREVPTSQLKVGDVVLVKPGARVPADGTVTQGESSVNEAMLTGESLPVEKAVGSEVIGGSVNENGVLYVQVTRTGDDSTLSRIIRFVEDAQGRKAPISKTADKVAGVFVPVVMGIALLAAVIWAIAGQPFSFVLRVFTSVLVIACPCALGLATPTAIMVGTGLGAKHGILIRSGEILEITHSVDTVVLDKTGTLTRGTFEVTVIHPQQLSEQELLELAALAESYSDHPISRSLKEAYGKELDASRVSNVEELSGRGVRATVDGRQICAGNDKLMEDIGVSWHPCHRVGTTVHVASDGVYLGHIVISDEVKPDAKEAITALKACGVRRTVMLTGDAKAVGESVAQELGLDEVHTQLLPADKVTRVEALLGEVSPKGALAFVGDGINDAPVLSRADIGIAMGGLGSDAAIEAADIVLMDDKPSKLADAIRIARRTLAIVRQNIVFALAVKFLVLALSAAGVANMWEAVFADVGVSVIAILNAMRALKTVK